MFHLAAYTGQLTTTADTAYTGLLDPVLSRSATSSLYIFSQPMKVFAGVAMSAGMNRTKLASPSLRQINTPYFRPVIRAAIPADGSEICWLGDAPLGLPANEEIGPQGTSDNVGPETAFFLMWTGPALSPVPPGDVFKCRATSTTAATAATWSLLQMTMEQALPPGLYAIVGSEHFSTTAIAHRWAIPNQVFRPGSMSHQAVGDLQDWRLMTRRLGLFGQFLNTAPPIPEVLCTAADAAHTFYLDLVRLSP